MQPYNHWRQFPILVDIAVASPYKDVRDAFEAQAKTGFDAWTKATNGRVTFEFIKDTLRAQIKVSIKEYSQSDGTRLGITTPRLDEQGYMYDCFINMNFVAEDYPFQNMDVATHEMGHALGIGTHSPNPADLMYFEHVIRGFNPRPVGPRDLNTLKTIYCDNFPQATTGAQRSTRARRSTGKAIVIIN